MFDVVINNADRKGGHLLPTDNGAIYGIDHGVTFAVDDKLRTLLWQWEGRADPRRSTGRAEGPSSGHWVRDDWAGAAGAPGGQRDRRPGPPHRRVAANPTPPKPGGGPSRHPLAPVLAHRQLGCGSWTLGLRRRSLGFLAKGCRYASSIAPPGQLQPADSKKSRLYVCGITPYDATHLGHAATYVAFDLMQRVWLDNGIDVNYVQNVTDIDDPLLERANATGQDWAELARAETHLFREDMAALRVLSPREYIGAVEAIPEVVKLIQQLQANGAAYELEGDIYFSVSSDPTFGHISHLSRDEMVAVFAERGGDPQRVGKKDPLDSLLWQAERAGEPAWDSAIGRGRPGWHIECAAIALQHLGGGFDVQGGGSDLAFPHHEMCAAQAQIATGRESVRAHLCARRDGRARRAEISPEREMPS